METYITLFTIMAAFYLFVAGINYKHKNRKKSRRVLDPLPLIYLRIWTGRNNDRLYAWYRTRAHLEAFYYGSDRKELIERVNQRIKEHREQKSQFTICGNGQIVEVRERGGIGS